MAEYFLTYLSPTVDERDFGFPDVKFLFTKGLVSFQDGFVVVTENDKDTDKFFAASRILQVDVRLNAAEEAQLVRENKKAREAVVYYHKIDYDRETQQVRRVRCIGAGDRPFGFNCFVGEIDSHFVKLIIPSFKEVVYVPASKIIGMDIKRWSNQ